MRGKHMKKLIAGIMGAAMALSAAASVVSRSYSATACGACSSKQPFQSVHSLNLLYLLFFLGNGSSFTIDSNNSLRKALFSISSTRSISFAPS